jgi:hypothetical protein
VFQANWTAEHKGETGTLRLRTDPFKHGLGHYTDVDGRTWDVRGIIGGTKPYVQARLLADAPGFYSTSSSSDGAGSPSQQPMGWVHTWLPYYVVVVPERTDG